VCSKAWLAAHSYLVSTGSTTRKASGIGSQHSNASFKRSPIGEARSPTCRSRRRVALRFQKYADIEREIGAAAGRINGAYGEADWTPIRYVNRAYGRSTLAGLYRAARVGLVTPLRDGMNLVAKEYVASQNPDDPGVLILSLFAGAARECQAALLVNPYDPDSVAVAIGRALSMPLVERRERHKSFFEVLSRNDIQYWAARFLGELEREPAPSSRLEQVPFVGMQ
jgi:trehalose-6-phosphate synthase